jgi:hypothetical protein
MGSKKDCAEEIRDYIYLNAGCVVMFEMDK